MSVLRLAVPSPLRRYFDYLPPAGLSAECSAALRPGVRLTVPFGRQRLTAVLAALVEDSDIPIAALKPAIALLDSQPLVGPPLLALCGWAAGYYQHPPGEVYGALFPPRLRKGAAHQTLSASGWRLSIRGRGLAPMALPRSPRQAQVIAELRTHGELASDQLRQAGISPAVLHALRDKGLIEACQLHTPVQPAHCGPGLALSNEQATVLQHIGADPEGFSCHLLEGVTGSGKTEIYLQLIAGCLRRGQQALVLIPEIGLTPQTVARFRQRFDANIAVFHSGLGEPERYRAWESARTGAAHIVIGTRSAVFTPLANPGLFIVDEEHDSSYKQQDGFRYSARDLAIKRAQLETCPVVLGSATPSLESVHNALSGRYRHHRLDQRAGGARMPNLRLIDVRRQVLASGFSTVLTDAIRAHLEAGRQALLFLNRRGYAPTLRCHDCGWLAECRHCDARLTVHRRRGVLRCHHCGESTALPRSCPTCHGRQLITRGLGTEQAEEFLHGEFADYPIYRVDSDSMQGQGAMQALLEQINDGKPCILLGTQMLTKGHHFPAVTLVAVIDTDAQLFSADFRGEERIAQLLTQVAGRAGRADAAGEVLLQTHYPDHPVLQAMLHADYAQQARALLHQRSLAALPPAGHLLLLRTDCADAAWGEEFLRQLRAQCEPELPDGSQLIGPLPSPLPRRAGRHRSQLLLRAADRGGAQHCARLLVARAEALPVRHALHWSIDVDPQDLF